MAIKTALGKLPDRSVLMVEKQWADNGFEILPLTNLHINAYSNVPFMADHRDPFDRLIIATALQENVGLMSADKNFQAYSNLIQLL